MDTPPGRKVGTAGVRLAANGLFRVSTPFAVRIGSLCGRVQEALGCEGHFIGFPQAKLEALGLSPGLSRMKARNMQVQTRSDVVGNSQSLPELSPHSSGCFIVPTRDSSTDNLFTAQLAALRANIAQLEADLEQSRAERTRLADRQARIMQLVGNTQPDHLVHDLRNILNERELLRTLMATQL
jgi:hypothetical protein